MNDFRRISLLLLVGMIAATMHMQAQGGRGSDALLYPQVELPLYVGAAGGYGWWQNEARFSISDRSLPCATFTDGEGKGPAADVRGFVYITKWLMVSPRVRFEARSGSFIAPLPGEPARGEGGERVMLDQEAQVDATMSAATFDLMAGVEIARTGLYVVAGPSASLLLDGTYTYTERLLTPGFTYSDTETSEHTLLEDQSFEGYESTTIDLRGGIGYLLRIGDFVINPEFMYSMPLTSALAEPELLKQTGMLGSIGVLYNIGH